MRGAFDDENERCCGSGICEVCKNLLLLILLSTTILTKNDISTTGSVFNSIAPPLSPYGGSISRIGFAALRETKVSSHLTDSILRWFDFYQFGIGKFYANLVTVTSIRHRKGRDYHDLTSTPTDVRRSVQKAASRSGEASGRELSVVCIGFPSGERARWFASSGSDLKPYGISWPPLTSIVCPMM